MVGTLSYRTDRALGLEINESKLGKFPYQSRQITGSFHADGSVAH